MAGQSHDPEHSDVGLTRASGAMEGGLWMLVLAILLSWLPLFGPLVAGGVGGRIVGERRRALAVALLPAVVLAVLIVLVLALFELPVLGAVVGAGVFLVVAFQMIPLLVGAWFGGALGEGPRATGTERRTT